MARAVWSSRVSQTAKNEKIGSSTDHQTTEREYSCVHYARIMNESSGCK
jgi:hypothetical protein